MITRLRTHKVTNRTISSKATSTGWTAGIESNDPTVNLIEHVEKLLRTNDVPPQELTSQIKDLITDGESGLERLELELEDSKVPLLGLRMRCSSLREKLRTYRGTISPIRKLPPEMLLEIFRYLLDNLLSVSQVCSLWRSFALSTSGLWTDFDIHLRRGQEISQLLFADMWLGRAGLRPLTITIWSHPRERVGPDALRNIVEPHFATLRELRVQAMDTAVRALFHGVPHLPLLENLCLTLTWESPALNPPVLLDAPRMHTLSLTGPLGNGLLDCKIRPDELPLIRHSQHRHLRTLHWNQLDTSDDFVECLRELPELEECHLFLCYLDEPRPMSPLINKVTVPKLRVLRLDFTQASPVLVGTLLANLTLPALTRLEIIYRDPQYLGHSSAESGWLEGSLLGVLIRSECVINTLILDIYLPGYAIDIEWLLSHCPDLKRLDIRFSGSNTFSIYRILHSMTVSANNPSLIAWEDDLYPLLPHLQQFRVGRLTWEDTELMIEMVKSRLWSDPGVASKYGFSRLSLITNLIAADEDKEVGLFKLLRGLKDHVTRFEGVHFFDDESKDYICT